MMNTYYIALAALFFTMFAIFPLHAEKTSALVGWESATPLLADANIEAGQKVAHVCASCHTFDKGGVNKFGPNLYNIVNNNHAQMEGFTYSDVLKAMHDKKWTYEALDRFLFNSKDYAPGSKMTFSGIKKAQDRANLIAWVRMQADKPAPLPKTEK